MNLKWDEVLRLEEEERGGRRREGRRGRGGRGGGQSRGEGRRKMRSREREIVEKGQNQEKLNFYGNLTIKELSE